MVKAKFRQIWSYKKFTIFIVLISCFPKNTEDINKYNLVFEIPDKNLTYAKVYTTTYTEVKMKNINKEKQIIETELIRKMKNKHYGEINVYYLYSFPSSKNNYRVVHIDSIVSNWIINPVLKYRYRITKDNRIETK